MPRRELTAADKAWCRENDCDDHFLIDFPDTLDGWWKQIQDRLPDGWIVGTDWGWGDEERFVFVAAEPNGHGGGLIRASGAGDDGPLTAMKALYYALAKMAGEGLVVTKSS